MTQAIALSPDRQTNQIPSLPSSTVQPEVLEAIARAKAKPEIVWEKLPANFVLPDDPVESIAQPLLAAALNDSLEIAERVPSEAMIASNMALVVRINQKTIKRQGLHIMHAITQHLRVATQHRLKMTTFCSI